MLLVLAHYETPDSCAPLPLVSVIDGVVILNHHACHCLPRVPELRWFSRRSANGTAIPYTLQQLRVVYPRFNEAQEC